MMLDGAKFEYTGKGPIIKGRWGDQPIQSLSDGYRSTLQWVLDFCAWAIYAGRFGEDGVDGGILLIDELEQHLHPRWQRHIVKRLRQQFPTTQIFATTHTPLVAAGIADIESAQVVRLEENNDGLIEPLVIRPEELYGLRADQVLTSEAFGLFTSSNIESETALDRYTELLGKARRTEGEEAEFETLRVRLRDHFSLGETKTEREAERIVERVLDELNTNLNKEHLSFETRQLLQDLLRPRSD
jgi:predicted ATP-binding protein involved in virulence